MGAVPELSIAIPLYNEEQNVGLVSGGLLEQFRGAGIDFELVLVDNGSADATGAVIDRLAAGNPCIKPVHLAQNQGYGGGILAGLRHCTGRYIGYTWGDRQVHAEDHLRVFLRLRGEGLDLCKATRVERHDGLRRFVITRIYNTIFPMLFSGCRLRDVNGCPKIFRREVFETLGVRSRDWFIDPEIVIKVAERRLKLGEVPVVFHAREHGRSKVNWGTVAQFVRNMVLYKLRRGRFEA